jgi:predicted nucleic acid-binding protein
MKVFFDTSVLVHVFYGDDERHHRSLQALGRFTKPYAACGAHSLSEVYSVLTRMPGRHRIGAEQAILFIDDLRDRLTVVSLTVDEHAHGLKKFASMGIVGGAIYDALLAHCALKARAEEIYSWNTRHYEQFGPEVVARLRTP